MNEQLQNQFNKALEQAKNLNATNIARDYLDIFVRVAKIDQGKIGEVIDMLLKHIEVHRSNTTSALYCFIKLADVSKETKKLIKEKIGDDFIEFYSGDENSNISNNAKILKDVLNGAPLSNFNNKNNVEKSTQASTVYNIEHSNLAINSPGAIQSINNTELNPELIKLIAELREAIERKDGFTIKKVFSYIADKSIDVAIGLLMQGIRS